jgi:hypothetical protein
VGCTCVLKWNERGQYVLKSFLSSPSFCKKKKEVDVGSSCASELPVPVCVPCSLLENRGCTLDPSSTVFVQSRLHMSVLGFGSRHACEHVFPRSAGSVMTPQGAILTSMSGSQPETKWYCGSLKRPQYRGAPPNPYLGRYGTSHGQAHTACPRDEIGRLWSAPLVALG